MLKPAWEIVVPAIIVALCVLPLLMPEARFTRRFPFITSSQKPPGKGRALKIAILIGTASVCLLSGLFLSCSQSSPSSGTQPTVNEIAVGFTNYQRITKSVVFVNPEFAMLCRGASQEEVEAARIKFGPHANTGILIYMNKLAADAFAANSSSFPVGAVIVKQKTFHAYTDQHGNTKRDKDNGVGGMVKRGLGYDPKHGDWEYFYFEDSAKIESGRISSCVQCHDSAKNKDYVFGTWRETAD